jgi:hypothetical protein
MPVVAFGALQLGALGKPLVAGGHMKHHRLDSGRPLLGNDTGLRLQAPPMSSTDHKDQPEMTPPPCSIESLPAAVARMWQEGSNAECSIQGRCARAR